MINIPEILVANGTGAFLVLFLLLYRYELRKRISLMKMPITLCL